MPPGGIIIPANVVPAACACAWGYGAARVPYAFPYGFAAALDGAIPGDIPGIIPGIIPVPGWWWCAPKYPARWCD
jgi:hypothetical protein